MYTRTSILHIHLVHHTSYIVHTKSKNKIFYYYLFFKKIKKYLREGFKMHTVHMPALQLNLKCQVFVFNIECTLECVHYHHHYTSTQQVYTHVHKPVYSSTTCSTTNHLFDACMYVWPHCELHRHDIHIHKCKVHTCS